MRTGAPAEETAGRKVEGDGNQVDGGKESEGGEEGGCK